MFTSKQHMRKDGKTPALIYFGTKGFVCFEGLAEWATVSESSASDLAAVWVNWYTVHRFCFCWLGGHCNARAHWSECGILKSDEKWLSYSWRRLFKRIGASWQCSCHLPLQTLYANPSVPGSKWFAHRKQASDTHSSQATVDSPDLVWWWAFTWLATTLRPHSTKRLNECL